MMLGKRKNEVLLSEESLLKKVGRKRNIFQPSFQSKTVDESMIKHRFYLSLEGQKQIQQMETEFGFNGFGEAVYYRTYSRRKDNGTQEHFPDTAIRVVEGIISVRKNHMINNKLPWNDDEWQSFGEKMGAAMMEGRFLPPGRGLWACGSNIMYERGSAACNNCGVSTTENLILGCSWTMDMLMCGVGVGSDTAWTG
ncbi:unnamed protein product, partial [marine sediment metagenome]